MKNRLDTLLSGNGELELAIEGRFTNLRIWKSKKEDIICIRIDKGKQYSVTLSDKSVGYLEKPNEAVTKLNKLYGFNGARVKDILNIIEITKGMKLRQCIAW